MISSGTKSNIVLFSEKHSKILGIGNLYFIVINKNIYILFVSDTFPPFPLSFLGCNIYTDILKVVSLVCPIYCFNNKFNVNI